MLSRVADSVYWLGRYVERAENVARFIDVSQHLALDMPSATSPFRALVATSGDEELFASFYGESTEEREVLDFLTFDRRNPNSIASAVTAARENARSIREIISSEMWEQVNGLYLFVTQASPSSFQNAPHAFYEAVKKASHLLVGITYLTMTHNEAWHFCRLGRLLERADKTSRIVDVKYFLLLPQLTDVGSTYDELGWVALLKSASALEMYRKRYGLIEPTHVVEFLLLDRRFPRSTRYCLTKASRSLNAITGASPGAGSTRAERELGRVSSEIEFAHVSEIMAGGLHEYLDALQGKLNSVGDAVFESFFSLSAQERYQPRDHSQ